MSQNFYNKQNRYNKSFRSHSNHTDFDNQNQYENINKNNNNNNNNNNNINHKKHNYHNKSNKSSHHNQYDYNDLSSDTNNIDKIKREIIIGEETRPDIKTEMLDYLYQNIDIFQLRYCIIKTKDHAQQLKQQTYFVTPHFHGYNYLLVIKRFSDNLVRAYLVYRMDLKFNRQDVNNINTKIYTLSFTDTNSIDINQYNDTVLDGKLVFKKDQKIFLINDILYLSGNKCLTYKLEEKIDIVDKELDNLNDILENNFELRSIRIYKYNEISDLVYNKIRNSDFKINGLVFLPNRSGKILIYINDNEFESIKSSPNLEVNTDVTNIKLQPDCDLKNRELLLQKTQLVDVYEVFTLDKSIRFGICAVPNIDLSFKLRNHFKSNDQLITQCGFDMKFAKWKPLL